MKKTILILGVIPFALSGCKELNNINWPDPIREQLVKYNIVEPKVDPTLTKEVQTVPTPDSPKSNSVDAPALPINLPEIPEQKMDETGPIFERSVTTGEDALLSLQGKTSLEKTQTELQSQPAVQAPTAPPNLFGTPLPTTP